MKIWTFPTCSPSLLASQAGLTRGFLEMAAGGGAGTMERVRRKVGEDVHDFPEIWGKEGEAAGEVDYRIRVILGNLICRK